MHTDIIVQILKLYDLKLDELVSIRKGYRNYSHVVRASDRPGSSRILNLILYKADFDIVDKIKNGNKVSDYLHSKGFSTRTTVKSEKGESIVRMSNRYICLYNYLPGETIPWEAYTQKHIKQLGKSLSDMHFELAISLRDRENIFDTLPSAASQLQLLVEQMDKYFSAPFVKKAIREKLGLQMDPNVFTKQNETIANLVDLQSIALHLDFVRSNVLFEGSSVSGIIDFEKVANGPALLDIARTLAFLIVDCKYKAEEKVRKYFLSSGYAKRGKSDLPKYDPASLESLLELYWFYDFYKFLLHNPYECLSENEHFIRTLDLLLRGDIIRRL